MPGGNTRNTVFFPPYPIYAVTGHGCRVTDADGAERLDFINNYSSLIHGHNPPQVVDAVTAQMRRLTAVGLPTEAEISLAELLCARLPSVERVRFMNSGTEAVMMALKAARAYTGRTRIAKVEGAYHGVYDFAEMSQAPLAENWGPRHEPSSVPHAPGTPPGVASEVLVLPFNNVEATRALLERHGRELAAVLLDVMPSRLSCASASPAFLRTIRECADRQGFLFVLDEVYSLRLDYRGAQGMLGLNPDLVVLGKIIGGGFPVGAVGGRAEVMAVFDPSVHVRYVPHGGTYNANPITMVAGHTSMEMYSEIAVQHVNALGALARQGLKEALKIAQHPGRVLGEGSVLALRLADVGAENYRDLLPTTSEIARAATLHRHLLNNGILTSPGGPLVISTPMVRDDIERLVDVVLQGLRLLHSAAPC